MMTNNSVAKQRHFPKGLFHIFASNAFFMVSLTGINALFVLYATKHLHFTDKTAYALYAAFISLFYSSSLIGGYLGSRFSHRNTAITGGLINIIGLVIFSTPTSISLYLGLALFIIGSGFFVPNVTCAVGQLYAYGDTRRDSGYTMTYIGSNIGGFIAGAVSGYAARYLGYNVSFAITAFAMVFSLLIYIQGLKVFAFQENTHYLVQASEKTAKTKGFFPAILLMLLLTPCLMWLLQHNKLCNILLISISAVAFFIIFILSLLQPAKYKKKMLVFLMLIIVSISFWSLYMLAPSALTLFISRNVDRHVFGHIIPAASFYSLDPLFIITIGPMLSILWLKLSKHQVKVTPANQFATGILLMGIGYLIFWPAIKNANHLGYIGAWWIVLSYVFQSVAELLIGPIGNSMVGALAPPHFEGTMMGFFQLSTGIAGSVSEFLAFGTSHLKHAHSPVSTNHIYIHAFTSYGLVTVGIGIVLLLMLPMLNRMIAQGPLSQRSH